MAAGAPQERGRQQRRGLAALRARAFGGRATVKERFGFGAHRAVGLGRRTRRLLEDSRDGGGSAPAENIDNGVAAHR